MKKTGKILAWLGILTFMILSFGFVENKQNKLICHDIEINITDSITNGFVSKEDILNVIRKEDFNVLGTPLESINTDVIEKEIREHPVVKNCEVYKSAAGKLHVDIKQRQPIVRVMNKKMQTYYIDKDTFVVPFTERYTAHVLYVNGNIVENKEINQKQSVPITDFDMKGNENILTDIYTISNFIYSDQFWKSQIMQVYVNEQNEFELVPRVGAHIIYFGTIDDLEGKFKKLKALYVEGFNKLGWNDHTGINLKYKNQVICTKR